MNLTDEKKLLIALINETEEEWILKAVKRLLTAEDENSISEIDKTIISERLKSYDKNPGSAINWQDVKDSL